MKVIITGSTGMIGGLLLGQCLESDKITEVRSLVRNPSGTKHPKLREFVIKDFENYAEHLELFNDINVAFFCIGAYSGQFPDDVFKKITVDYAVNFAKALKQQSASATICLLSGAGADRTEKSKTPFARYKGMAENQIAALGLSFYALRPGYIYPVSPRKEPNMMYRIFRVLYPVLKIFGEKYSIKSTELASAIFNIGLNGAEKQVLENHEILKYK